MRTRILVNGGEIPTLLKGEIQIQHPAFAFCSGNPQYIRNQSMLQMKREAPRGLCAEIL